jgi:hypothetical protein
MKRRSVQRRAPATVSNKRVDQFCPPGFGCRITRAVKFYPLTRGGRARLEAETANWKRLSETVGLILGMAEGGAQ